MRCGHGLAVPVFEIRLARKIQNKNTCIDSIEKIWPNSVVQINFHWPWAIGPLLTSMTAVLNREKD